MNVRRAFRSRRVRHYALLGAGQLAAIATTLVLFPHPVAAACGVTDPGACINDAQYSLWATSAGMAWQVDSMLLALAYQLARLRYELVETIFTSAYNALTTFVSPLIIPMATLALLVGVIALFLVPLLGHTRLVNIRHVVVWALLAPLLLTQSGDILVQLDTQRTTIAQDIFTQVGTATSVSPNVFGPQASDMPDPRPLYPASPCRGGGTISRPPGSPAIGVDSLAATVAWANAGDIWCPQDNDPSPTFPDAFTRAAPDGPGWALESGHPGDYGEPQSSTYVQGMQQGSTRLWLAIIPCVLAVLDSLVQLLFSLSMIALWVGLPLALVTVFFQSTAAGVTMLARRVVSVFQVSWSCSVLLGIVFIALSRAIELRNVAAYVGFATGAIFMYIFVLWTAGSTLIEALQTLRTTIAVATGLDAGAPVRQAQQIAGTAAGIGAAAATGGASLAVAGGAAAFAGAAGMAQTGSGVYAASAAAGRFSPTFMQLGEVAAALGYADQDSEVIRGLEAGHMGERSTQQMRRRMREDNKIKDDDGETYRERAEGRSIRRAIEQVPQASATSAVRYDPDNGVQFTEPVPQRFADHTASSRTPVYREAESNVDTALLTKMGYTWQRDAGRVRFWQDGDTDGPNTYANGDTDSDGTNAGADDTHGTPLEQAAERAAERVRLIEAGAVQDDLERATRLRDATQAAAQAEAKATQAQERATTQAEARTTAQAQDRATAQTVARAAAAAAGRAARQGAAASAATTAAPEATEGASTVLDGPELPSIEREEVLPPIAPPSQAQAEVVPADAAPQQSQEETVPSAAEPSQQGQSETSPAASQQAQDQATPDAAAPQPAPSQPTQEAAAAPQQPQPQQGKRASANTDAAQMQQGERTPATTESAQARQGEQASVVFQEPREERPEVLPPVQPSPAAPQAQQAATEQSATTTSTTAPAQATDTTKQSATTSTTAPARATDTSKQGATTTSTTSPAQATDTSAVAEPSAERVAAASVAEQRVAAPAPPPPQIAVPAPPQTVTASEAVPAASSDPVPPVEDKQ